MSTICSFLTGMLCSVILALGGTAIADSGFTPPPLPSFMTERPCATPDHFFGTNCYWNEDQMGDGSVKNHYVHNFRVQGELGKVYKIRCYMYSTPDETNVDHCVAVGGQAKVSGWYKTRP